MNILIITPFYKHDKNIASVRWTNISKRLAKKHNVTVVTQPFDDMDMKFEKYKDEDNILVARINQKTDYEKIAIKHFSGATGDDWQNVGKDGGKTFSAENVSEKNIKRKIKDKVLYNSMGKKAKEYASFICKNVIPEGTKIDVVISSACPFIEMMFGYELKKKLSCKWICDFRDLPFFEDNCDSTHREKKIMQKELNEADAVITIAPKGKEVLADGIVNDKDKIHIITNGFSMDDSREPKTINDGILHIVHTGSLYGGTRKADLLFEAIQKVQETNSQYKFVFECAGANNSSIIETAKKYSLEDIVVDKGFIPREQAIELQNQADILLMLVYDRPGSLAAKIFEYMLCKKPIISITCGNGINSEETRFTRNLNIGIAAEEANKEEDLAKLVKYLEQQANKKKNNLPLEYNPDIEQIKQFDHDVISQKIEQLCFDMLK